MNKITFKKQVVLAFLFGFIIGSVYFILAPRVYADDTIVVCDPTSGSCQNDPAGPALGVGNFDWIAQSFTATQDGQVVVADLLLDAVGQNYDVRIGLYTNNAGVPGDLIANSDTQEVLASGDCSTTDNIRSYNFPPEAIVENSGVYWLRVEMNPDPESGSGIAICVSGTGDPYPSGSMLRPPSNAFLSGRDMSMAIYLIDEEDEGGGEGGMALAIMGGGIGAAALFRFGIPFRL